MLKKWITWANGAIAIAAGLLLLSACVFLLMSRSRFPVSELPPKKAAIQKSAFARPEDDYKAIENAPSLQLAFSPLSVQLPDLRRQLIYYGKNGRPDAKEGRPALFFSFTGNKMPNSLFPGERYYVYYDRSQTPNQYIFSPGNAPAPLWIETSIQGNQALVKVSMETEEGKVITEPKAYAEFTLPEKEYVRFGGNSWELGKWRVDGTMLARQKARWYGTDKFLEKHGGEEYKELMSKQRIDFGEGEEIYSVYVGQGDCMVWEEDRWHAVKVGEGSLNHTLMCIKKVDDRVMNLELWDVDGKGKITLNLVRANEPWAPQNLEQNFKFVGARTRSQFVFEVNKERVVLKPHDWLVLIDGNWRKIVTPKEIDDYVERRIVGPLFVFDHVERKDDKQVVVGTLFNAARTETAPIELTMQQAFTPAPAKSGPEEKKHKDKESKISPVLKGGGVSPEKGGNKEPRGQPGQRGQA